MRTYLCDRCDGPMPHDYDGRAYQLGDLRVVLRAEEEAADPLNSPDVCPACLAQASLAFCRFARAEPTVYAEQLECYSAGVGTQGLYCMASFRGVPDAPFAYHSLHLQTKEPVFQVGRRYRILIQELT